MRMIQQVMMLLMLLGVMQVCGAAPPQGGPRSYAISADSLDNALRQLLAQSQIDILYSAREVAGLRSSGVSGRLTDREALAGVLRGTGYTAVEAAPGSFILRSAPASPGRQQPVNLVPTQLDAVHVTGSRIPRLSLQTSVPLSIITRQDIVASGRTSLAEILALHPLLKGHRALDVSMDRGAFSVPLSSAAGASMYELGPRGTLVLVDGRRIPSFSSISGELGSLPDLNGVPVSWIDRIEVMGGGASAIYGADAMAGVINIILRDGVDGAEVEFRRGLSNRGDADRSDASLLYGVDLNSNGNLMVGVALGQQRAILGSERSWLRSRSRQSKLFDLRYPLGTFDSSSGAFRPSCPGADRLTASDCMLDPAIYASILPENKFGGVHLEYRSKTGDVDLAASLVATHGDVRMSYAPSIGVVVEKDGIRNFASFNLGGVRSSTSAFLYGGALAFTGYLGEWTWEGSGYRYDNVSTARIYNLFRAGSSADVDGLIGTAPGVVNAAGVVEVTPARGTTLRGHSSTQGGFFIVRGSPFSLAERRVEMVAGLEVRKEAFHFRAGGDFGKNMVWGYFQKFSDIDDTAVIRSAFSEASLPIANNVNIDLAMRTDRSARIGLRKSPRVSFKWALGSEVSLRGSWSKGYREPSIFELREPPLGAGIAVKDASPFHGNCSVYVENGARCLFRLISLANPNLRPEESWTALFGVLWAPSDAFSLSLDRYHVVRNREIYFDTSSIERDGPDFSDDLVRAGPDGKLGVVAVRMTNDSDSSTEGWQIESKYHTRLTYGGLSVVSSANYLQRYTRGRSNSVYSDGRVLPRLKAAMTIEWSGRAWKYSLITRFRSGARPLGYAPRVNPQMIGDLIFASGLDLYGHHPPSIPSMTTFDFGVSYELGGWQLGLNVINVADRFPVNRDGNFSGVSIADDDSIGRYLTARIGYKF